MAINRFIFSFNYGPLKAPMASTLPLLLLRNNVADPRKFGVHELALGDIKLQVYFCIS